jgi:hypothetical protein
LKSQGATFDAAPQPGGQLCVYVHGNRIEWSEAFRMGMQAYRSLARSEQDAAPMRFVIWSWPSSQICGPLRDVRVKAARTDPQSVFLAQFLSQLPETERVGLLGFSYGARIICGALHVLGGGRLGGWSLPDREDAGPCGARAVLFAAAANNYWLSPGSHHGRCLTQVDRLYNFYNPCDSVLRIYPRLDRRSRAGALGYTGLRLTRSLGENAERYEQRNVSGYVGRSHDEQRYLCSLSIMRDAATRLLWKQEAEELAMMTEAKEASDAGEVE